MPRNKSYAAKLRDPRWQKTRLQIMERDKFACVSCDDATSELQVHHGYYVGTKEPWEYEHDSLWTLCGDCHAEADVARKHAVMLLGTVPPLVLSGAYHIIFADKVAYSFVGPAFEGGAEFDKIAEKARRWLNKRAEKPPTVGDAAKVFGTTKNPEGSLEGFIDRLSETRQTLVAHLTNAHGMEFAGDRLTIRAKPGDVWLEQAMRRDANRDAFEQCLQAEFGEGARWLIEEAR